MPLMRVLAVLALVTCGSVLKQEQERSWSSPQELCVLDNKAVSESSGVAPSRLSLGVFYTHNDSGDSARFFRFQRNGKVDGTYELRSIEARDWEDMASAVVGGQSYLYFADVGDNAEARKSVVIHRVIEPTRTGRVEITEVQSYTVTYPDRAHNCEAMFVTGQGDVWVVTKNAGGISKIFVIDAPSKTGQYKFRHVADIAVDTGGFGGKYVTGADVSPDNTHVVLRTYSAALEFKVVGPFENWHRSKPTTIRTMIEVQGEAICYTRDGSGLVTTSEYSPCPVSYIPLKGPSGTMVQTGSNAGTSLNLDRENTE